MANPGTPLNELKLVVEEFIRQGRSQRAAAIALNMPRSTLRQRLKIAEERGLIPGIDNTDTIEERERRAYLDTIKDLRRELDAANRAITDMENLRQSAFGLSPSILPATSWTARPSKRTPDPLVFVLFTSDFQWGERIDLHEMDGLNSYSAAIASARYRRLIQKTVDMISKHRGGKAEKLYYLRGGDSISGEIHHELQITNDLSAVPAIKDLAEHERNGLRALRDALDCPIEVISTPGNHDRMKIKPISKSMVEFSFDNIISWFLEATLEDDELITFHGPPSGDAVWSIWHERICLTHGDRIGSRGGQGFIGPAATIARGQKKLFDYYATQGDVLSIILTGHFHVALELELGFANGTLAGLSEFARDLRYRPKPPTQWLFGFSPTYGLVSQDKIYVGHPSEGSLCRGEA